jgi:hypothetical protein
MPKAKRNPASFDNRLLLALKKGCQEETRFMFPDHKAAVKFRHELHSLRAAMRDNQRLDWQQLYAVGIYIRGEEPNVVVLRPKAGEYKEILDAAGVPDPLAPGPDPIELRETLDPIEDFLSDIKNLK